MNLTISSNNHADVQKNDDERISSHPARLPAPKTSFLIALVIIALVCLVSSCSEPEVEIIEPPKPPLPIPLPESIYVINIYFQDELTGWLSVLILEKGNKYKGGIFKTTDSGVSWYAGYLSENATIKNVCFTDKLHGWAPGNKGNLFFTSDGGTRWLKYDTRKFLGEEDTLYNFVRIYFRDCNEGWIVGSKTGSPIDCGGYGYLFHTTNAGNDWTIDYATTAAALTDVCMLRDGNGWMTGGGHFIECTPFILHTSDNGNTWGRQSVSPFIRGHVGEVKFLNNLYGFAFGPLGILRTTNGGEKWDTTGTSMEFTNDLFLFNDSVVFTTSGSPAAIMKSIDKGRTWVTSLRTVEDFQIMYFLNDSTGWAAGTRSHLSRLVVYKYRSNVWAKIR